MVDDPSLYTPLVEDYGKESLWALDKFKNKMSWEPKEFVLEVGCGTGQNTFEIVRKFLKKDFRRLVGADSNLQMIAVARKHWRKDTRVEFVKMDVATKCRPMEYFDNEIRDSPGFHKAMSFFCLHWVKDRSQMFNNLNALLRIGGTAMFHIVTKDITFEVWDRLASSEKWKSFLPESVKPPFNEYMHMSDPGATFASEAKEAGFEANVEIVERKDELKGCASNDVELKIRVMTEDPILPHIPKERKEEYLEENLKLLREIDPRGPVDYTCMLVFMTKKENVPKPEN